MRMHCVSHFGSPGALPHCGSHEGRGFGAAQGPHCHHGPLSFGPLGLHGPHGHGHSHGHGFGFGRWAPYGPFGGRGRWGAWSAWGRPGFDLSAPWQAEKSGCGPWGRHDCGGGDRHHHQRHAHAHDHEADHDHGHGHRLGGGGRGRGRRAGGGGGGGCERRARSPSPESECGCGCEGGVAEDGASRCRVWWADEEAAAAAAAAGAGASCCGRHRCHARGDGQAPRTRPRAPSCPPALGAFTARDR